MPKLSDITPSVFDQRLGDAALRPFAVEFYGQHCSSCAVMEQLLEQILVTGDVDFPIFKVSVDAHPAFAERFEVKGLPTLLAVKSDASVSTMPAMPNRTVVRSFLQGVAS